MQDDADLVRLVIRGDHPSYDELIRRWSGRVYGYICRRVRDKHIAEDLTQDAFIRGFKGLHSLEEPSRFGSWLLAIAHRAVVDWARKRSNNELVGSDIYNDPPAQLASASATEQRLEDLREVLMDLPEQSREILNVYYFQQMTYEDAAAVLGVSVATVNVRLAKAREQLRKRVVLRQEEHFR